MVNPKMVSRVIIKFPQVATVISVNRVNRHFSLLLERSIRSPTSQKIKKKVSKKNLASDRFCDFWLNVHWCTLCRFLCTTVFLRTNNFHHNSKFLIFTIVLSTNMGIWWVIVFLLQFEFSSIYLVIPSYKIAQFRLIFQFLTPRMAEEHESDLRAFEERLKQSIESLNPYAAKWR